MLTTPVLNWIVGPAFVVTVVTLLTPRVRKFQYQRSQASHDSTALRAHRLAGRATPSTGTTS